MAGTKTFYSDYFKIPLAGPAPYNTLVVVNQWFFVHPADSWEGNEDYRHFNVKVLTMYSPSGYDPNSLNPVAFEHATTFAFINTAASNSSQFLYAVDEITDAGFDPPTGAFYVSVNTVVQLAELVNPQGIEVLYGWEINVAFLMTSFVMVNEPAPDATLRTGSTLTKERWIARTKDRNEALFGLARKQAKAQRHISPQQLESARKRTHKLGIEVPSKRVGELGTP